MSMDTIVLNKKAVPPGAKHAAAMGNKLYFHAIHIKNSDADVQLVIQSLKLGFTTQEVADTLVYKYNSITLKEITELISKSQHAMQSGDTPTALRKFAMDDISKMLFRDDGLEWEIVDLVRYSGDVSDDHIFIRNKLCDGPIFDVDIGEHIVDQDHVRRRFAHDANTCFSRMKQHDWDEAMKKIIHNFRLVKTDDMATKLGRIKQYLKSYLNNDSIAEENDMDDAIVSGKPFYHGDKGDVAVNTTKFARHVNFVFTEKHTPKTIAVLLKRLDCKQKSINRRIDGKRYSFNVWLVNLGLIGSENDGTMDDGTSGDGENVVADATNSGSSEEVRGEEGAGDEFHEGGGEGTLEPTDLGDGRLDGGDTTCNLLPADGQTDDSGNKDGRLEQVASHIESNESPKGV